MENSVIDSVLDAYNEALTKKEAEYKKECAEQDRKHEEFMNDFQRMLEEQQQADQKAFEEMLNQ